MRIIRCGNNLYPAYNEFPLYKGYTRVLQIIGMRMRTGNPDPLPEYKKEDLRELTVPFLNSSKNYRFPTVRKRGGDVVYVTFAYTGEGQLLHAHCSKIGIEGIQQFVTCCRLDRAPCHCLPPHIRLLYLLPNRSHPTPCESIHPAEY
ncbi:hypothetical protein D3C74_372080 [compost metagenome]